MELTYWMDEGTYEFKETRTYKGNDAQALRLENIRNPPATPEQVAQFVAAEMKNIEAQIANKKMRQQKLIKDEPKAEPKAKE
jgi:hypothetical protein